MMAKFISKDLEILSEKLLRMGIDIGSTTIKLVVLDQEKKLVYQNYARHFSEIGAAL